MLSYCLKHRKNRESRNPMKGKNEMKLIVFSKCAVCDRGFIGKQEKRRLLSN